MMNGIFACTCICSIEKILAQPGTDLPRGLTLAGAAAPRERFEGAASTGRGTHPVLSLGWGWVHGRQQLEKQEKCIVQVENIQYGSLKKVELIQTGDGLGKIMQYGHREDIGCGFCTHDVAAKVDFFATVDVIE